ncbi:MAG: hypothetical protein H0V88_00105 [Pyrinomonadaceae bacterium]|nr:hypothetical protein [Pyrinomonadaceae bacterium]
MRRYIFSFMCALLLLTLNSVAGAQTRSFTSQAVDYTLELPNATWRAVSRPDSVHQHTEFVYGDRADGLLRVRKEVVDANTALSALARRDQDMKLRFLPGYVEGKQESFAGRLPAITTSYEYTAGGKPMSGRVYYLQTDNRTIYALHFTGARDKLNRIRNQTDSIVRSFQLK